MGKIKETNFKTRNEQTIKEFKGGRSWMGAYDDGTLGFCSSQLISQYPQGLDTDQREVLSGTSNDWGISDMYRVEIDVRLVLNKKGQPIVKRAKSE